MGLKWDKAVPANLLHMFAQAPNQNQSEGQEFPLLEVQEVELNPAFRFENTELLKWKRKQFQQKSQATLGT